MKKSFYLIKLLVILNVTISYGQPARNCFNTQFDNDVTSLNMKNAYLLGYLSTMIYADNGLRFLMGSPPPGKESKEVKRLQFHDDVFLEAFKDKMSVFFTPSNANNPIGNPINTNIKGTPGASGSEPTVTFKFHHKCSAEGYDPEAILISTPSTIFVVFRGTDRVSCAGSSTGYEWNEWLATDFRFNKRDASMMHASIRGQVHKGMVESVMLQNFSEELSASVSANLKNKSTGVNKKVWITGHSLGGAHAQLFALYLKYNYNIIAQGLYLFSAPHPGDATYVAQLNNDIGKSRIQRFEFGDDPICTLPPQAFFYARAGERNYFKDYNSSNLRSEHTLADDAKILCAFGNLPGEQIPNAAVHFQFPPYCPGSTCFHHPEYILEAVRHQLNTSSLSSLPAAVPVPTVGNDCTAGDVRKGENNDLVDNTLEAGGQLLSDITVAAVNAVENLATNLIGGGDGDYKIVSYKFKNCSRKYLSWNGTVGDQLTLSTSGTIFKLVHKATGGYQLARGGGNMAPQTNSNNIIMKNRYETVLGQQVEIIGDEETWYVLKVPNKSHAYVLYNWNSRKVLDAPNAACNSSCSCTGDNKINQFSSKNDEATQVWVLERQ